MNLKILANSNSADFEAEYENAELVKNLLNADTLVDTNWCNVAGKRVIITIDQPIVFNSKLNEVISRVPIKAQRYTLSPYDITKKVGRDQKDKVISKYIMNKYIMATNEFLIDPDERFIIGTDISNGDYLNQIGYIIY